jgi:hypothetical protein
MADLKQELRQKIERHFDEEELRTLCLDLYITYANLTAQGHHGKVRELVEYCDRHNCLKDLIEGCGKERPNVTWPQIPSATPDISPKTEPVSQPAVFTSNSRNLRQKLPSWVWGVVAIVILVGVVARFSTLSGDMVITPSPEPTEISQAIRIITRSPIDTAVSRITTPTINTTSDIQTAVAASVAQTLNAQTVETTPTPTSTLLFTPSPTPSLVLSNTSDSTETNQTITPLSASAGIGQLTVRVRVLEECNNKSFSIQADGLAIGGGQANTTIPVGEGTYDIIFTNDFDLGKLMTQTVEIQKGEETVVDFTDELGAVLLTNYPAISLSLPFYANAELSNKYLFVDEHYCASIGMHTIRLLGSYLASAGYNTNYVVTVGLFDDSEMTFDIEVRDEEQTIIGPDMWPRQLGVVSFAPPVQDGMSLKVFDLQTGEQLDYSPYVSFDYFGFQLAHISLL